MKKNLVFMIMIMMIASISVFSQDSDQSWFSGVSRETTTMNPLYICQAPDMNYSVPASYYFPAKSPDELIVLNENAEDFNVPSGDDWSVEMVAAVIDIGPMISGIQYIDLRFYNDIQNTRVLVSPTLVPFHTERIFNIQFVTYGTGWIAFCPLNQPLIFEGGKKYWVSFAVETFPSWQWSAVWFNAGGVPTMASGSPAPFFARTTPFETGWSFGPSYYDSQNPNPFDLTLLVFGELRPEPVPFAGWLIPAIFAMIAITVFIRYRRV